jgi:hypothetical protein
VSGANGAVSGSVHADLVISTSFPHLARITLPGAVVVIFVGIAQLSATATMSISVLRRSAARKSAHVGTSAWPEARMLVPI